jgi:serine/threonine protein kinase
LPGQVVAKDWLFWEFGMPDGHWEKAANPQRPPLSGRIMGQYHVGALIGAGGMGQVYRAHDSKLGRDVALKTLPIEFALNPEWLARFRREARTLASLNHPNIGAIYGLEEFDGTTCLVLVLELVEGETLQERLKRGPIPMDEALPIAKQIAEALEAAHECGVIHRDLKPANVKITPRGKVKVLDFGLAKAFQEGQHGSVSESSSVMNTSMPGAIFGTAAYMSPEQAKGQDADRASDMWSFGCVLYEMITGRAVFEGDTVLEVLYAIFQAAPDWDRLPRETPEVIRRLLRLCLRKDRDRRLQSAHDTRIDIDEALTAVPSPITTTTSIRRYTFPIAVLLLVTILIGAALWLRVPIATSQTWSGTLLGGPAIAYGPRISPDGKILAFKALVNGQSQVAVMNPKAGNWTLLTNDKNAGQVEGLSWFKDSSKIYFSRIDRDPVGKIFSVSALGGEERLVLENAILPAALPDGGLVIVRINPNGRPQLYRFRPDTGEVQPLNALLHIPNVLLWVDPFRVFLDGGKVVFIGTPADPPSVNTAPRLYVLDLNNNRVRTLGLESNAVSDVTGLAVSPIDQSIFVHLRNGDLHQIMSISEDARIPAHVLMTLTDDIGFMDMAADGSLYVDQIERPMQALRFTDSAQQPEPLAIVPVASGVPLGPELPDGRILLTALFDGRSLMLAAKPTGELAPFVDTDEETRGPAVMVGSDQVALIFGKPPEQSIAIVSVRDGRILQRRTITTSDFIQSLTASSDGTTLYYCDSESIWSMSVTGGEPHKIGAGYSVAFDPSRQSLLVLLRDIDGAHLVRMPVGGGPAEPIPISGELRIAGTWLGLGPSGVRSDGQVAVSVMFKDSWFNGVEILDPASGKIRRVPLRYDGDIWSPSWNQKNQIIAGAFLMRSSIWRFRPAAKK